MVAFRIRFSPQYVHAIQYILKVKGDGREADFQDS